MTRTNINGRLTRLFLGAAALAVLALTAVVTDAQVNRGGRSWDTYPNWGGSFQLRQTALNAGFNKGSEEGRKDHARGRRSNYTDFADYRNATKDYSSRLGDRELYRAYYQIAFERGYDTENRIFDQARWDQRIRDSRWNTNRNTTPRERRGRDWDRYGTYGGSFQLRQTALNAGYNEGYRQGQADRRRNRMTDFRRNSAYQNATKDYSTRLGDRALYQRYYRDGYENGYHDGYEGY